MSFDHCEKDQAKLIKIKYFFPGFIIYTLFYQVTIVTFLFHFLGLDERELAKWHQKQMERF